jgi:hypothetical protein
MPVLLFAFVPVVSFVEFRSQFKLAIVYSITFNQYPFIWGEFVYCEQIDRHTASNKRLHIFFRTCLNLGFYVQDNESYSYYQNQQAEGS